MPGIENYGLFIIAGIILNITPGADTMYILGRSIAHGRKAGVLSVFGIITGALIHTIFAAFGLSVVLSKSEFAFDAIKYAGAGYIGYLGIKSLLSKAAYLKLSEESRLPSLKIYLQGMLTNLLNPKVALFYLAFLPQFVSKDNNFGVLPFFALGFTFITTGTIWCLFLALFASGISTRLRQNKNASIILNKLTGILFICLGVNLFWQKM